MNRQPKPKKCAVCKEKFTPQRMGQNVCGVKCSIAMIPIKERAKIKKEVKDYRLKTKKISEWIAEAQTAINSYVRARDHEEPCISCGFMVVKDYLTGGAWHAGHYRSRGSAGHLRFNLHNIHRQCAECNLHRSGSVTDYRERLMVKIGVEKVEALECNNAYRKIDRDYCERIKRIFNKKTKMQKKRLGIS